MKTRNIVGLLSVCMLIATPAMAGITTFDSDIDFQNALATFHVINFDDVDTGDDGLELIDGERYAAELGSPSLSLDSDRANAGMYVATPDLGPFNADFVPTSGDNVFSPGDASYSPEGALTVEFDQMMYGIGAWFLDVETDFAVSGVEVNGVQYVFDENQGDDSQSFLGVIDTAGFTSARILMAYGDGAVNGVGIDDLQYGTVVPIPVPGAALLGVLGLGLAGWIKRRVA